MRKKTEVKTDKTDKNLEKLFDVKKKTTTKVAPKKVVKPKVAPKKATPIKEKKPPTPKSTPKAKSPTKPKKSKEVKIIVPARPYPESWKEMDKIDKKIIKLTENLKSTIIEGIDLISTRLETEQEQSYRADLKDYLEWIVNLNKETEKFYNFGK